MINLKQLRQSRDLTLEALGNDLGVTTATVWQWENSKRQPDIKTLIRIANYFDTSIDYLVNRSINFNDEVDTILLNNEYILNKDKLIPLFQKVLKVDKDLYLKLEGYIDALIEKD